MFVNSIEFTTFACLANGNMFVYDDIYWQALAYHDAGIKQMERLFENGEMTAAEIGYWRSVSKDAWAGNLELFEHEQVEILQPWFDKMPTSAAEAAAESPTRLFPGATLFGEIGDNIAIQKKRWDVWIVDNLSARVEGV